MPFSATYDMRDLRLFNGRDLRALLLEEARLWRQQLKWDYTQSIELLLGYLDSRILPGFVAVHRPSGKLHGYTFAVQESQKAVLGDLFVTAEIGPEERERVQGLLLRHQLPMLQHTPGTARVESQLLLAGHGLQSTFNDAGFASFERLFMEAELPEMCGTDQPEAPARNASPQASLPTPLKLKRWTAPMYQPAAELIHRAYLNHGDTIVNDQYGSVQGCLRFLHNIVRFPGCGTFAPEHSWVIADERTGEVEALALITRVEPETAHVPQLCVGPKRRGQGLGRLLLRHAATNLAQTGVRSLTLTVTAANTGALNLYKSLGFHTRHSFHANVWTL